MMSLQPTYHLNNAPMNVHATTSTSTAPPQPSPSSFARRGVKRAQSPEDPSTSPTEKRAHYESHMVNGFDSIQLDCDSCSNSPNYIESIEECIDLGDSPPPTIDVDVADASPLVEEPDDEEDDARLMMSEELRQYINLMKQEKLLPSRSTSRQLSLYNPADDIKQRITELDECDDIENNEPSASTTTAYVNVPSTNAASSRTSESSMATETDEEMEID